MITSRASQLSCVMKLSHFLRFYENMYGIVLPPEKADQEAADLGIIIDRTGEATTEAKPPGRKSDVVL